MFKATFVGTVFNKQCYLGRTIYTIEQQEGFENIQVVYANDGSTDRTGEILNHFKDKYKDIPDKFVVVDMPENVGISKALNEAHKYAKSDIIIICSGDDAYMPYRAKRHIEFLESNKDVDVCYGSFISIKRTGEVIENKPAVEFRKNRMMLYNDFGQFVPHGFMAFRTKCLEKVKYNPERKVGIDHEFILDLYEAGYVIKEMPPFREDGSLDSLGYYVHVPKRVSEVHIKEIREADRRMLIEKKKEV